MKGRIGGGQDGLIPLHSIAPLLSHVPLLPDEMVANGLVGAYSVALHRAPTRPLITASTPGEKRTAPDELGSNLHIVLYLTTPISRK